MSAASLSMLEQLMVAQAQECIFRGLLLTASSDTPNNSPAQLQLAQEAAQVRPRSPAQEPRQAGRAVATQGGEQGSVGQEQSGFGAKSGTNGQPQTRHPQSSAPCPSLRPVTALVLEVLRTGTEALDAQVWLSLESRARLPECGDRVGGALGA